MDKRYRKYLNGWLAAFFVPKYERMMLMILSQEGQTYRYGDKVFTIGGMVWSGLKNGHGEFGIVQEIHMRNPYNSTAYCEFGGQNTAQLDLNVLEPVSQIDPEEVTRGYMLSYCYRCGSGEDTEVLSVSTDKSILLRLMLEHMKSMPYAHLASSLDQDEGDFLQFGFKDDADEPTYAEYTIAPIYIYSNAKEAVAA